jgi:ABC-type glycerol-3-phosphate transport system substrate-binding protein
MRNAVIIVIVLSIILGIIFWRYSDSIFSTLNQQNQGNKKVELIWWGLFDEEQTYQPLIDSYQLEHPNVKITYVKQSLINYRPRLQTQIRAGQGPDIFMIHSSWIPMFKGDITPAPSVIFSALTFSKDYYPVIKDNLVIDNQILGIPVEVDGLALYYNEDLLKFANVTPPKTWQQFLDGARKVTVKNQQGQIETAGTALGTTTNVDFWPEILGLLFLQQPDSNLASPGNKSGGDVLKFYTSFVTDPNNKTWDVTLPSSTQMFINGKLAFLFANSKKAEEIRMVNPNLNFKVIPVPQLPGGEVNWGGFWVYSVANKPNSTEAWLFLKYLSSAQSLQLLYQNQAQNQIIGRAFPRKDMADLLQNDTVLGAFISEAPTMKSWYLNSDAKDQGINDEIVNLYQNAVDGVVNKAADPQGVLQGMDTKIKSIIDKYTKPVVPTSTKT